MIIAESRYRFPERFRESIPTEFHRIIGVGRVGQLLLVEFFLNNRKYKPDLQNYKFSIPLSRRFYFFWYSVLFPCQGGEELARQPGQNKSKFQRKRSLIGFRLVSIIFHLLFQGVFLQLFRVGELSGRDPPLLRMELFRKGPGFPVSGIVEDPGGAALSVRGLFLHRVR